MQDKDAIAELQAMIEGIPIEPQPERKVNQVRKNFKISRELRMTVYIGDFNMITSS